MDRKELEESYLQTTYRASLHVRLRIGEGDPTLDLLLRAHDATEYAFLTAWNPRSQPRGDAENLVDLERLVRRLRALGHPFLLGAGEPDDAEAWEAEPSVLVLGLPREAATALGREFGQNAILVGIRGGAPELVWLDDAAPR